MKKAIFIILIIQIPFLNIFSQQNDISYYLETTAGYVSPGKMPFWLRSNQYGSIPIDNASLSLMAYARKEYDRPEKKFFDWGAGIEGRINAGNKTNFNLIEGYGKIRLGIFELRAGRSRDAIGLRDSSLSSGSFSVSGNSPGIPKVEISVPGYYVIPFFGNLFAFRGQYAHGWIGYIPMRRLISNDSVKINTFLHQKSLYGRFGKPEWKWKLYGGFNHQVKWGNEKRFYEEDFTLSPFVTYLYVITGKRYTNGSIRFTRLGDHIGSIDIGFEYEFDGIMLTAYRQNFYEAGNLAHLANIQDGLNGISFQFRQNDNRFINLTKFLFEFLYTKNQAGEPWSPVTTSPYENYYNHGHYMEGWSYNGINLGTPFITTREFLREDLPSAPVEYFVNNRVSVLHFGFEGTILKWDYMIRTSWSKNYGTYWTTDDEQSTGLVDPGRYGIFGLKKQLSTYFDFERALKKGINIGFTAAFDIGELYYDSSGILLRISHLF